MRRGEQRPPEYIAWAAMKKRCNNPADPSYHNYGGRGIRVCERWEWYDNFIADMGPRSDGMTLERLDNDKDYSPDNCVWTTHKHQHNNKRTNVTATINGETLTLAQWAERSGLSYTTIVARRRRRWPDEHLLLPPDHSKRTWYERAADGGLRR